MNLIQYPFQISDAAVNMATDLHLLRTSVAGSIQVRFYGWSRPCWTFGYTQSWDSIQTQRPDEVLECIRRPTGGGIVDHRFDFTYCLVIPNNHTWWRSRVYDVYEDLHRLVAVALANEGATTRLLDCRERRNTVRSKVEACFDSPAVSDVMDTRTNKKLAGAALKRTREGLLIQGSILKEAINDTGSFSTSLASALAEILGASLQSAELPSVEAIEIDKFRCLDWNRKR